MAQTISNVEESYVVYGLSYMRISDPCCIYGMASTYILVVDRMAIR